MSVDIRIEGDREIIEAWRDAESNVRRVAKRYFRDWSIYTVKRAQINILNEGAVDTNELIQGINYKIKETKRTMTATVKPSSKADKYAAYVEHGTKPHFPPIKKIQGWADRHGIPAFLVARAISKWGTPARYIFRDTFYDMEAVVDSELDDFLGDIAKAL